jgi:hypothetical protein
MRGIWIIRVILSKAPVIGMMGMIRTTHSSGSVRGIWIMRNSTMGCWGLPLLLLLGEGVLFCFTGRVSNEVCQAPEPAGSFVIAEEEVDGGN